MIQNKNEYDICVEKKMKKFFDNLKNVIDFNDLYKILDDDTEYEDNNQQYKQLIINNTIISLLGRNEINRDIIKPHKIATKILQSFLYFNQEDVKKILYKNKYEPLYDHIQKYFNVNFEHTKITTPIKILILSNKGHDLFNFLFNNGIYNKKNIEYLEIYDDINSRIKYFWDKINDNQIKKNILYYNYIDTFAKIKSEGILKIIKKIHNYIKTLGYDVDGGDFNNKFIEYWDRINNENKYCFIKKNNENNMCKNNIILCEKIYEFFEQNYVVNDHKKFIIYISKIKNPQLKNISSIDINEIIESINYIVLHYENIIRSITDYGEKNEKFNKLFDELKKKYGDNHNDFFNMMSEKNINMQDLFVYIKKNLNNNEFKELYELKNYINNPYILNNHIEKLNTYIKTNMIENNNEIKFLEGLIIKNFMSYDIEEKIKYFKEKNIFDSLKVNIKEKHEKNIKNIIPMLAR